MNTKVRFFFDNSDIKSVIELLNPPTIPFNGELISFDWPAFISNKKDLRIIAQQIPNNGFKAMVLSKHFTSDEVEIRVILIKDIDYEKEYPQKGDISADYLYKCMLNFS